MDSYVLISFSTKNIYVFHGIFIQNGIITIELFSKIREIITKYNNSNEELWINRQISEIFGLNLQQNVTVHPNHSVNEYELSL